jgi:hypothetical protein
MEDVAIIIFATLAVVFLVGGFQLVHLRAIKPLIPDETKKHGQQAHRHSDDAVGAGALLDAPMPPELPPAEWLTYYKAKNRTLVSIISILVAGAVGSVAFRQFRGRCHIMSLNCNELNAQLDFKDTGEHTAKFCKEDVDVVSCGTSTAALYTFHPSTDTPPSENGELTPDNMAAAPNPIPLPSPSPQPVRDGGVVVNDAPSDGFVPKQTEFLRYIIQTVEFRCDAQPAIATSSVRFFARYPSPPRELEFVDLEVHPREHFMMCKRNSRECYRAVNARITTIADSDSWYSRNLVTVWIQQPKILEYGSIRHVRLPLYPSMWHISLGEVEFFESHDNDDTRGRKVACSVGLEDLGAIRSDSAEPWHIDWGQ